MKLRVEEALLMQAIIKVNEKEIQEWQKVLPKRLDTLGSKVRLPRRQLADGTGVRRLDIKDDTMNTEEPAEDGKTANGIEEGLDAALAAEKANTPRRVATGLQTGLRY